jgi:hypothetical protein
VIGQGEIVLETARFLGVSFDPRQFFYERIHLILRLQPCVCPMGLNPETARTGMLKATTGCSGSTTGQIVWILRIDNSDETPGPTHGDVATL